MLLYYCAIAFVHILLLLLLFTFTCPVLLDHSKFLLEAYEDFQCHAKIHYRALDAVRSAN